MARANALILSIFGLAVCVFGNPPDAASTAQPAMSIFQAIILGLIEGLTEYLPVSSTGHLVIASRIMGLDSSETIKEAVDAYSICIQAGAILAVLLLYKSRFEDAIAGLFGKSATGKRLILNLMAGFIPAAVLGLLLNKLIKSYLFGPWPIAIAWFVGGFIILLVERKNPSAEGKGRPLEELTPKQSLIIGFAQCIAMWPGFSRSLSTILGARLQGLSTAASVEFSFLLGLITLGAATCYEGLKSGKLILDTFGWLNPFIGFVTGFLAAIISVKWMVGWISRRGLSIFGWYRILLSVLTAGMIFRGWF